MDGELDGSFGALAMYARCTDLQAPWTHRDCMEALQRRLIEQKNVFSKNARASLRQAVGRLLSKKLFCGYRFEKHRFIEKT